MAATANSAAAAAVMDAPDVERAVRQLARIPIEDIGGSASLLSAAADNDKVPALVHELLVSEAWRRFVLMPHLLAKSAASITDDNVTKAYMMAYHESTVLQLLQSVMYDKAVCLQLGDAAIDLVDYCARSGARLLDDSPTTSKHSQQPPTVEALMNQSARDRLREQIRDVRFACAIQSLSCLRYLTDCISELSLGVMQRLFNKHDIICQLVAIVDKAPWQSTDPRTGQLLVYEAGQWSPTQAGVVGKVEGQVWIALYNLLVDSQCRRNYQYTTYRQEQVLKLRPHLTQALMDQLPFLTQLYRMLEELSMMQTKAELDSVTAGAKIELLPEIWDEITTGKDWKAMAARNLNTVLSGSASSYTEVVEAMSSVYNYDVLEDLMPEKPRCGSCGQVAAQRCSRCQNEWYCSRPCQVKAWKAHKQICSSTVAAPLQ